MYKSVCRSSRVFAQPSMVRDVFGLQNAKPGESQPLMRNCTKLPRVTTQSLCGFYHPSKLLSDQTVYP
jgi:hypothetical protein